MEKRDQRGDGAADNKHFECPSNRWGSVTCSLIVTLRRPMRKLSRLSLVLSDAIVARMFIYLLLLALS
jgi:hypothetical protein